MSTRLTAMAAVGVLGTALVAGHAQIASADPLPNGAVGSGPCAAELSHELQSIIPERLEIPVPYPVVTPVPFPAPEAPQPRIASEPLPADPCTDPCPDLTTEPPPPTSLSTELNIPQIGLKPAPFHFGIPVPGPDPGPLPPPPEPAVPGVEPAPRTPAPPTPRIGKVDRVAKLTGAGSVNRTDKRWQVQGTDLGIMWESAPGQVAIAFGDTIGKGFHPPGGQGDDWRSNVLAFSTDRNLSDGMSFDSMVQDGRCHAAELLSSRKLDNVEITTIPTSGFAVGDRQYMSYMSIRTWNSVPGTWWTNHGGIAYSDDGGSTWTKDPYAQWDNIFGVTGFQVAAMVPAGEYVYMFGTPNTRLGAVGLARVPRDQVLNKSAYQYWSNGNWTPVGGAAAATPIVHGPAAELSVRYDESTGRWQMSYLDTAKTAIVLREANSPQGEWSDGAPTVSVLDYPELYGGFIHPWSRGNDLYFTISTWSDYNVFLMRARVNE
ncbi:DUF4185 domain-containing protein [Rhodococcus sp. SGAir0479]|uniref:DUF4185 domain-containing protein n=1 Tax=Rhodococcus sp. SGAir0479 TaxID=2567884 RepID=UPI0010CCEE0A|nr:DUF4185 domain-containing protein [Rhodococcus sp. SGAir0479]QCQ92887.1 DUF4185 domain-containing protein [Rhodococcus sp. SGAir0479]